MGVALLKSFGEGRRCSIVDLNCEGVSSLGEPRRTETDYHS